MDTKKSRKTVYLLTFMAKNFDTMMSSRLGNILAKKFMLDIIQQTRLKCMFMISKIDIFGLGIARIV